MEKENFTRLDIRSKLESPPSLEELGFSNPSEESYRPCCCSEEGPFLTRDKQLKISLLIAF